MPLFIIISVALSVEKIKGVISKVIAYLFLNGHWQTNSASCFSLRLLSLPENHSWVNLHTHTHSMLTRKKVHKAELLLTVIAIPADLPDSHDSTWDQTPLTTLKERDSFDHAGNTHALTVPLGKQEMSRSWRRVSPTSVQGARSMLPRPVQQCDCSGRESRQTAFTGTSPAPGCEGSRISDLSTLPSSPEGNYLQETSQASRSTRHPKPLQLLP